MNDLQKDQAIYNEMLQIANEVFNNATANNEVLRKYMNENGGVVSINDILKPYSDVYNSILVTANNKDLRTVTVDTFTCSFPPMRVFELVKYWKSLAKAKGDIIFTYEEEINREFAGSVEIRLENAANAKLLANSVADDELRPVMNNVLLEINATSGDIYFVASDGHELAIISNSPADICKPNESTDMVFQALYSKTDWKRICDYARKQKSSVCFEIYRRSGEDCMETMVAVLGDTKVKSQQVGRYPNWKSVLPDLSTMKHFNLADEDVQSAKKWLSKVKAYSTYDSVAVSVYKGSDIIYFDTDNATTTFRLSRPSDITLGSRLSIKRMQTKKFYGFWFPKFGGGTIVDDANCDLMLVMPLDGETTPNKKDREVHLEVWPGIFAQWQTLNGDFANVRVEAVNTEAGTATIRTKGWNRYKVDVNSLRWNYCEEYTFPSWVSVGQFIQSEGICGTITEVNRSYVTLDNNRIVSYKDLFVSFVPATESKAVETQAA